MDVKWDRDCPTFPLELFANIIDHQDRDALAISSLVCTSWRSFAQPRLFSRLQFDERRIKMFIDDPDIVDSPLSTIRDLVKVVVIYDRLPFEHAEIVQLLSSFKKVTELSYGNPFRIYNRMDEKTAHDLAETFHSITAVTLFATFRTFQQMITFICAFPFLVKVNMKAEIMTGYQYPSYPHINCQPSPTLRALKLHCRLYEIIPWLLQLNPIPQITELTLKDFLGANFIYIGKLLSTLGPSLKRLTLVETTRCPYAMLPFHEIQSMALGIQSNSELEYLQFSCLAGLSSVHALTALIVQIIISQATSLSLREVSISVGHTPFDPVIWERTDEVMARLPSPYLENFTVRIPARIHTSSESVKQAFPLCHRLGILQVIAYDEIGQRYQSSHD